MTRTRARREWPAIRWVLPNPRDIENAIKEELSCPYREPTLVPLGEKPKAYRVYHGRGNSANQPRTFGIRGACSLIDEMGPQVAVTRGSRLFNKNTDGCKPETVCIAIESWPVAVPKTRVQPG